MMLLCTAWAFAAAAEPPAELDAAERALARGATAEALKAADAGLKRSGLERDALLRLLEVQAVAAASSNPAKATKAFEILLSLEPDHALHGDDVKRASGPFRKAKAFVLEKGPLSFRAAAATLSAGQVFQVALEVTNDPLKLARRVRFHLRPEHAAWAQLDAELYGHSAAAGTEAASVQWWAEVLNERDGLLGKFASAESPRLESAHPPAAAVADASRPPPAHEAPAREPPAQLTPSGDEPVRSRDLSPPVESAALVHPGFRAAGYACLGGAVASGAAGAIFGWSSSQARKELEAAQVDEQGRVIGLTQREAYALDERARSQAILANTLFGVAGGLVVTGAILWLLGGDVVATPTAQGVEVSGVFP